MVTEGGIISVSSSRGLSQGISSQIGREQGNEIGNAFVGKVSVFLQPKGSKQPDSINKTINENHSGSEKIGETTIKTK